MRRALSAAIAVAALGCAHSTASGSDPASGYKRAVKGWTAGAEIYQYADQRAQFFATIESRVFRQQRARERARELAWPAAAELAEVDRELKADERETTFIVAAYTEIPRENDLGDAKSIWRLALMTPAGELAPTAVDQLGRPDENMQTLYPYMDRYVHAYRIHFPKVTQGPVTLLIASGVGKVELTFEQL